MITSESIAALPVSATGHQPYRQTLFILQEGIALLNPDGRVVYINDAGKRFFEKRLGRSPAEGDRYLDFVHPSRRELTQLYIENALAGVPHLSTLRYPQNKIESWFHLGYYPVPDDSGCITNVCVKAQEITEEMALRKKLLKEKRAAKNKLLKAVLAAQEKERASIGRELHDDVNQVLATVKLYTEMCFSEEGSNKVMLQKAVQKLNYCISEIRRLSHHLSFPALENQKLTDLLLNLCDETTATRRITARFFTYGVTDKVLSAVLKTALYRIAQEQVANVLKHAAAADVELALVATSINIALQISDNGNGADLAAIKNGVGLLSMTSRTEALGGHLQLETSPGKGFQLMVEIPLNR